MLKRKFQAAGDQAFGNARRAKQKHAFSAQGRQQTEPYGMATFEQPFF
jgi:hypothetical protein